MTHVYNYYLKPDGSSGRSDTGALELMEDLKRERLIKKSIWRQLKDIAAHREKPGHNQGMAVIRLPDGTDYAMKCGGQTEFLESITNLPAICYDAVLSKYDVFDAVVAERERQDAKWGAHRPQSLAGMILVMESELEEVKKGWMKNLPGKSAPLNEIVQLAAVCFATLEKYGLTGNTACRSDDIPHPQEEE